MCVLCCVSAKQMSTNLPLCDLTQCLDQLRCPWMEGKWIGTCFSISYSCVRFRSHLLLVLGEHSLWVASEHIRLSVVSWWKSHDRWEEWWRVQLRWKLISVEYHYQLYTSVDMFISLHFGVCDYKWIVWSVIITLSHCGFFGRFSRVSQEVSCIGF